jgi:hypothetical protein
MNGHIYSTKIHAIFFADSGTKVIWIQQGNQDRNRKVAMKNLVFLP